MRFWIKIGVLAMMGYVGYDVSALVRDRKDQHAAEREAEVVTGEVTRKFQAGELTPALREQLWAVQHRLAYSDARWKRDASNLLLLPD